VATAQQRDTATAAAARSRPENDEKKGRGLPHGLRIRSAPGSHPDSKSDCRAADRRNFRAILIWRSGMPVVPGKERIYDMTM
jgi:hypothetical protein